MALKTLKPRLATAPSKTIGGATHQPKSRWGHGRGGRPWRRKRQQVLLRDKYTCQDCGRVSQPSDLECDHIMNTARGGTDELNNLQTLCKKCHAAKTAKESALSLYGDDGNIRYKFMPEWLQPIPKATIVFGPPGSGKTTWAMKHSNDISNIIDLDLITSSISGKPIYYRTEEEHALAVRERNELLGSYSRKNEPCIIILTGTKKSQRDWWINKIQPAKVQIMDTPKDICISRVRSDKRRPTTVVERQIQEIYDWEE